MARMPKYAYQNFPSVELDWHRHVPHQTRAADVVALGGGGHHHHGGGGGWRGGYGPAWWGPGYDYPSTDVYVVQPQNGAADPAFIKRAMAYIMSLPKAQRGAAYKKIFGKAPDVALGMDMFDQPAHALPRAGAPEILGGYEKTGMGHDCGCGCKGTGACKGKAMGAFDASSLAKYAVLGGVAYLGWKMLKKKR